MALKDKYLDKIVYDYTTSSKSRPGEKLVGGKASAQVSHDTGNPGSTAKGNAQWFKSEDKVSSSAHTFTDDKEIRIIIPLNEKAWHVLYNKPLDNHFWGDDANDIALGHELCYGKNSKGVEIDFEKAYDMWVWIHVYCAKKFNIPLSRIKGHFQLDPGRKTDPVNALSKYGKTWAGFLADVEKYFNAWESGSVKPAPHVDELVHTVIKGDTLWSIATQHSTTVDNLVKLNPGVDASALKIGSKLTVKTVAHAPAKPVTPAPVKPVAPADPYAGKKLISKVAVLNFYDTPRWNNPSGTVTKGLGFPTIVGKVKTDGSDQYKVKNSKGKVFYITASDKYVTVTSK